MTIFARNKRQLLEDTGWRRLIGDWPNRWRCESRMIRTNHRINVTMNKQRKHHGTNHQINVTINERNIKVYMRLIEPRLYQCRMSGRCLAFLHEISVSAANSSLIRLNSRLMFKADKTFPNRRSIESRVIQTNQQISVLMNKQRKHPSVYETRDGQSRATGRCQQRTAT